MARIVPKLNLNKTPQNVDNMSLVFAKNIKLRKDNTLGRDNRITCITPIPDFTKSIGWKPTEETVVGYIPYNNKIYFFHSPKERLTTNNFSFSTKRTLKVTGNVYINNGNTTELDDDISSFLEVSVENPNIIVTVCLTINGFELYFCFEGLYDSNDYTFNVNYKEGKYISSNTKGNITGVYFPDYIKGNLKYFITKLSTNVLKDIEFSFTCDTSNFFVKINKNAFENEYYFDVDNVIISYDEIDKKYNIVDSAWSYSGGIINGYAKTNLRNETLLVVAESDARIDVPLKTINVSQSSKNDDESIYTQTPIIPIKNFILKGFWSTTIPNGVYQFFVRYVVKENNDYKLYTNWFPVSKEIFVGTRKQETTLSGDVKSVNLEEDASSAPYFDVETVTNYSVPYSTMQVGFILSTKDSVVARGWKHFDINSNSIYFDYDKNCIEELEVKDVLKSTYGLYDVGNITSFKNKTYISNYKESNFNKYINVENINITPTIYSDNTKTEYLYKGYKINISSEQTDDYNNKYYLVNSFNKDNLTIDIDKIFKNASYPQLPNEYIYSPYNNTNINTWITLYSNKSISENFKYDNNGSLYNFHSEIKLGAITFEYFDTNNNNHYGYIQACEKIKQLAKDNDAAYFDGWYYYDESNDPNDYDNHSPVNTANIYTKFAIYYHSDVYNSQPARLLNPIKLQQSTEKLEDTYAIQRYYKNNLYKKNITKEWDKNLVLYLLYQCYGIDTKVFSAVNSTSSSVSTNFSKDYFTGLGLIADNLTDNSVKLYFAAKVQAAYDTYQPKYEKYSITWAEATFGYYFYMVYSNNPKQNEWDILKVKVGMDDGNQNHIKLGIAGTTDTTNKIILEDNISTKIIQDDTQKQTLSQGCNYNFYIHFLTKFGEITNGLKIGESYVPFMLDNKKNDNNKLTEAYTVVPIFNKSNLKENLSNYVSYFYSIEPFGRKLLQLFNVKVEYVKGINDNCLIAQCLELSTLVNPIYDDITILAVKMNSNDIITKEIEQKGKYYDSGQIYDKAPYLTFGNGGVIIVEKYNYYIADVSNMKFYAKINNQGNNNYNPKLVKCTPYYNINTDKTKIDDDYNLLSYVVDVKYPTNIYTDKNNNTIYRYVSGTNVYTIDNESNQDIKLDKIKDVVYNSATITNSNKLIVSSYNFNYVNLTNDISSQIRDYTIQVDGKDETYYQLIYTLQSLLLCDVYSLNSMYRDYIRKTYVPYSINNTNAFTNTIRSSKLVDDENEQYIEVFDAEDYYNVPTDKGIITNIKAIGNIILVHTKDSLYKFSGKSQITSSADKVQLEESDPFDTGVDEIFGNEFGYAGLSNKFHSHASQFGYIWWDKDCSTIYLYAGEGQLAPISDPISKLLKSLNITNIKFGGDYYNDRFFICIEYLNDDETEKQYITLSYNVKAKSFISLHDFYFTECINTKVHTYFINIFNYNKDNNERFGKILTITDEEGPYDIKYVKNRDNKYPTYGFYNKEKEIIEPSSVIDIIYNANYETIKTLNAIHWICNKIENFFTSPIGELDKYPLMAAEEEINSKYPGNHLMIYTDTCRTDYVEINDNAANYMLNKVLDNDNLKDITRKDMKNSSYINSYPYIIIDDKNKSKVSQSYEKPTFNLGKWTFNYFRNVINTGNSPNFDTRSLIIGKYFVVRFIFDDNVNFKLENLDLNFDTTK